MKFFRDFDRVFFGYGRAESLALIRIILGSLTALILLGRLPHAEAWYTNQGLVPADLVRIAQPGYFLNPLASVDQLWAVQLFIVLAIVCALATTVGAFTRVATIGLFLAYVFLTHRNPFVLHSGDTLLRLALLYLAVSRCGAAYSLDRIWKLRRLKQSEADAEPEEVPLWPQRLIQFQLSVVYITTVWAKWQGYTWREGYATWYPPHLVEFERFPVPGFFDQQPFLAMATYGTLLVQLALAILVYHPSLRKWVLIAGLFLHAAIEYRFNVPYFSLIICTLFIAHYSGAEVSGWVQRTRQRLSERFPALSGSAVEPISQVSDSQTPAAVQAGSPRKRKEKHGATTKI